MKFQLTNPAWIVLLPLAVAWIVWLSRTSDVQLTPVRKWAALVVRLVVTLCLALALTGLQWLKPLEGMTVFFLLDRSDSIPTTQQEQAREYVNQASAKKKTIDKGGVIVFGNGASIESAASPRVDVQKVQAVIGGERTDAASAVRLGSAAFPETGQKRLVLLSDGNENAGSVASAMAAARTLGVSLDVVPLGVSRSGDVSLQKLTIPPKLKRGQAFEVRILAQADRARSAKLRFFRNNQFLGEQPVELSAGKNLFALPQTITEAGFYSYDVQLEAPGDPVAQNNRASTFAAVRGDPRILLLSSDPAQDAPLVNALRASRLEVKAVDATALPGSLAEIQSFDAVFLSNVAAGDLGEVFMRLLESAVRDFGVGLVCIGGDQAYAAGAYRGTPLEKALPVDMELNSKKVLPSGALALIMHGMEFNNGNQVARETALAALDALGPQDELGVVLWDGTDRWLFPLTKAGDKKELGRQISGMNQGDLPTFQHVMEMAHEGLKKSTANLKHIIVFSDGDPGPPTSELMQAIVNDRITVSTVLISGHAGPETMIRIAEQGRGRFYDVRDPGSLPQIFIKEAMVILKSAIFEEPFRPQLAATTELVRGISASEYPELKGYVCATPKGRAEVPLLSPNGDPVLAHWQYGLGRSVAFTSDAKARWAADWVAWEKYRQFWSQTARWSLKRVDTADLNPEVSIDRGEGVLTVEAMDAEGNYRSFLNLQAAVVSPKGERITARLQQTGPGRYEARFPATEVGAYLLNVAEIRNGQTVAAQSVGAAVSYSPEFSTTEPNHSLLQQVAESGGGRVLSMGTPSGEPPNPYLHDRQKTYQPRDLWEGLLKFAVVLFVLDVAVRRIFLDREEWSRVAVLVRRRLFFWRRSETVAESTESLTALLATRNQVRSTRPASEGANVEAAKGESTAQLAKAKAGSTEKSETAKTAGPAPKPVATASRLLDAKKRAAKKMNQ